MIELSHLAKSFDGKCILKDVSLLVPSGKKVTIIGPSGSGKSTILKLILCLLKPDSGKVERVQYHLDLSLQSLVQ